MAAYLSMADQQNQIEAQGHRTLKAHKSMEVSGVETFAC